MDINNDIKDTNGKAFFYQLKYKWTFTCRKMWLYWKSIMYVTYTIDF